MNLKFKNLLSLLAVAISIFSYAQTPTLIASGVYKASGSGASGVPTVSINIPTGKNRLMMITTYNERVHNTYNSNWVTNPDGNTTDNILYANVNGISSTYLDGWVYWKENIINNLSTITFNTLYITSYISDAMGLSTGNQTITFPGINLPENSGDEMIVEIAVFENAKQTPNYRVSNQIEDFTTASNFLTITGTASAIPIGNAASNIVYYGVGAISQQKNVTFSSGWTNIGSDIVSNTAGTTAYTLNANEQDGIGLTTAYTSIASGNPTFNLSRSATNPITGSGIGWLYSILPLARPSVAGTVYRDNNGLTGGINNGGTGGGVWNTANALYVNAIDINGNIVATALVNTSGVFSFPSGGNLIEGDLIRFELSRNQGIVGQPAPLKQLPNGWGTVGESITSGSSDGTQNGEFTLTIGTANSPNNTTNRFGVTTCLAGVTPPIVKDISNTCPSATVDLSAAHTGTVPAGASLVWFTNNTHTGTALSGTQITQAGAGTYYAFYYDSTNNCYSPVSSAVTATINILDSDGDGIPNECDSDDDNDGILDTDECSAVNTVTNGVFSPDLSGWSIGSGWYVTAANRARNDNDGVINSSLSQTINNLDRLYNGTIALSLELGAGDQNNASGNTATLDIMIDGIVYATITNGSTRNTTNVTASLASGVTSNFATFGTSGVSGITFRNLTFNIPYTGSSSAVLAFRMNAGGDDWTVDNVVVNVCTDLDGDGIPNYLDLDSDGDGCPDAIEGSGNFNPTTMASGTIATQTPNINFGTAIDANGIPVTVGSGGQGIGQSIDKFKNDCIDSDNDGYPDWQDLDDDNDGILDINELVCITTVNKQLNYFFNIDSGNYIQTATPTFFYNYSTLAHQDGPGITSNIVTNVLRVTSVTTAATRDNNDYLDFPFAISDEGNYALSSLALRNTGSGRSYKYDVVISSDNFATSTPLVTGGVTTGTDNTVSLTSTFTPIPLIPGTNYKIRVYLYNRAGSDPTDFDNFSIIASGCDYKDTDGDGIPNHLDLDSDGDGCTDAIEGGAAFTSSNLVNSTMAGGNSGGSYTGTSTTPVVQNLGNTVGNTPTTIGVPTIAGTGQTVGDSQNGAVSSQCITFCYKPGIIDVGNTYPSKHGITSLGRAGAENDNWPMVRQSAWTVLESKTKGFVINRVKFNASNQPVADNGTTLVITNPVEGMMVYDTTNNCLKIYTSNNGGSTFAWHCMSTQACPQ